MTTEPRLARNRRQTRFVPAIGLVLASSLAMNACAISPPPNAGQGKGMSCLDDSSHCVSERRSALRNIVTRSDRHWVRDPATVDTYASGVRLFAFKSKKRELTCDELQIGRKEADGAGRVLRGPDGRTLTPAQISRGAMLGEEVSRELAREHARRCAKG